MTSKWATDKASPHCSLSDHVRHEVTSQFSENLFEKENPEYEDVVNWVDSFKDVRRLSLFFSNDVAKVAVGVVEEALEGLKEGKGEMEFLWGGEGGEERDKKGVMAVMCLGELGGDVVAEYVDCLAARGGRGDPILEQQGESEEKEESGLLVNWKKDQEMFGRWGELFSPVSLPILRFVARAISSVLKRGQKCDVEKRTAGFIERMLLCLDQLFVVMTIRLLMQKDNKAEMEQVKECRAILIILMEVQKISLEWIREEIPDCSEGVWRSHVAVLSLHSCLVSMILLSQFGEGEGLKEILVEGLDVYCGRNVGKPLGVKHSIWCDVVQRENSSCWRFISHLLTYLSSPFSPPNSTLTPECRNKLVTHAVISCEFYNQKDNVQLMQGVTLCLDGLLALHQKEKREGKEKEGEGTAEGVIVSEEFCELLEKMWDNVLSTEQRKVSFFIYLFVFFFLNEIYSLIFFSGSLASPFHFNGFPPSCY